jgi:ABC-type ATPase involved in cell division
MQGVPAVVRVIEARQRNGRATLIATHDRAFADAVGRRCLRLEGGRITSTETDPPMNSGRSIS